ncbi:MAG: hypothetical protein NC433_04925 [Clostridiales bacterium]|nr:hypothetical protein [Clostridiales bacterium]
MIDFGKIEINTIDDYDQLLDYIDETHIDLSVVSILKKYIGTKAAALLIEYPYYEKDYLSTYYTFYSKQHTIHSKVCFRLHFFGEINKESNSRIYYGYISLREGIKDSKIGKTYLSPKLLIDEGVDAYLMLDTFSADVFGEKLLVDVFPWMKQETDVSVCAHVAMWSILRYYGNRYKGHRDTVMGEIVEMVQNDRGRKIPSKGLTPNQIVDTLDLYNFSPVLLGDEYNKLHYFVKEIIAYIESGIPIVATMNKKRHAVTLFGHGRVDYDMLTGDISKLKEPNSDIILHSSLITTVYAMDDNHFPYKQVDIEMPCSDKDIDYALKEINYLIVPYCQKVLLGFNEIYEKFMALISEKIMKLNGTQICRIYLTSSNSFKEKAKRNNLMNSVLKERLLLMDMPRFIWCIDLSTIEESKKGLMSARVIADSTVGTRDDVPWLMIQDSESIKLMEYERKLSYLPCDIGPYRIYENNLQDINNIKLKETMVWGEIYD